LRGHLSGASMVFFLPLIPQGRGTTIVREETS